MKRTKLQSRGWGAWATGAVTSLLLGMSAFAQFVPPAAGSISIPDFPGLPTAYPSKITVTNVVGSLEKVTVTLNTVTHSYANDVEVMLVAPDGQAVVLMSNAGGGQPLGGVTLTFDDDKGATLPQFSGIGSGTYKPANYGGVTLPAPAPVPSGSTLAHLAASQPNGDWKLYVADNAAFNSGSIGSWTVSLYTTPVLTQSTNRIAVLENSSGSTAIGVYDSSTASSAIKFSVTSDNTSLLPVKNIVISGSGTNRTVTVTPSIYLTGQAHITVTGEDEMGAKSTLNFLVDVLDVNQRPQISVNTNLIYVLAGGVSTNLVAFLTDLDFPDPSTISINVTSSDPNLISPAGVRASSTPPWGRHIAIVPSTTSGGTVTLTFVANDGTANSDPVSVVVSILPVPQPLFAKTNEIALTTASSSSSVIPVSGVSGLIGRVEVSLKAIQNWKPQGSTIRLTGPGGTSVTLLSGSSQANVVDISQLTFIDGGTNSIPAEDTFRHLIVNPTQPLSAFANSNPNINNWTLTIDNGGVDTTSKVLLGWQLKIYTAPVVGTISDVSFLEDGSGTVAFSVADADGSVAAVHPIFTNAVPIATATSTNLSGTTATLTIAGLPNKFGTNYVQVVAVDNNGYRGTNWLLLKIAAQNDAPSISFIGKQVTFAGKPIGPVTFTVDDPDNDPLTITATSSNPKILPQSNIYLTRTGNTVSMMLFPAGVVAGESFVTITASDGQLTDAESFTFYVQPPANPLYLSPGGPITITANSAATPYPSTNQVSGLVGSIAEVQVTLFNFTHQQPANVNVVLVAPNGDALVLMQNVGGSSQVNNLTLVFGDSATSTLNPSTISSGVYRAVDGLVNFPATPPPPAVSVWGSFAQAFNGDDPNGTWKLYVFDEGTDKSNGTIENWMLSIRTGPKITAIPDTEMNENTPKCIDITVGDVQPGVDFNVTAENIGPDFGLIPNANIGISVKGAGRTLCFTNAPYKYGSTAIRVTATDDLGNTSQDTFTLTVRRVNLPPVISSIPDQSTPAAVAKTVTFTAWSPQFDSTGATNKVSVNSDNPGLVPNSNISVRWLSQTDLPDRPDTDTFELTVLPAGIQTGTANILVTVTDAANQKTTISFKLTVTPSLVYAYEKPITIPLGAPIAGEASPYPAIIPVSGIEGLAHKVTVSLPGFSHTFPSDVSVLLVDPAGGKSVMLLSHAGGDVDVNNARLTFSDTGSTLASTDPLVTGTFKPAQFGTAIKLPPPAPQGTYNNTLSAFSGSEPNGDWKLYVYDESFPDGGEIAGGAMLFIETKPAFKSIAQQTTPENTPILVPISIFNSTVNPSNLTLTATSQPWNDKALAASDNTALNPKFGFEGFGGNRFLWITNAADQPSKTVFDSPRSMTNKIVVTATDPNGVANSVSFYLVVTYVNQAPRITSSPTDTFVDENTSGNSTFVLNWTVTDPDSELKPENTVIYASNKELIRSTNINVASWSANAGQSATISATLKATQHMYGTNTVTLALKDKEGNWTTNSVTVGVKSIWLPPVIEYPNFAADLVTNVTAGATKTFAVKVGSTEVNADNITVWATSSADIYVPNAYIATSGSGSNRTVRVTAVGEAAGSSIITVYATDGTQTNSRSFTVTVNADSNKSIHADTTPIAVNGTNLPAAYPSIITVPPGTFQGKIAKLTVLLDGLAHNSPANLDIMLVGPDGETAVMLMSGAGDAFPVSVPIRVTFDDSGAPLPTTVLTEGTYHPGTYTKNVPPNAPTKYSVDLAAFNGKDPNGSWRLYVYNNGGTGGIMAGWKLNITTGPVINVTGQNLNIDENGTASINFTVADDFLGTGADDQKKLTVAATSSNPTLLPVKNISIAPNDNQVRTATLKPELYQSGQSKVVLTVTSPKGSASTAELTLNVTPKNILPTISRLDNIVMTANEQRTALFLVSDGDTRLEDLDIEAYADNATWIPTNKLLFFGKSNPLTTGLPASAVPGTSIVSLSIDPEDTAVGQTTVHVIVTDPDPLGTNVVEKSFLVDLQPYKAPPTISDIPPQFVARGNSLNNIAFTVTSPVATVFNVSASSSDENLVRNSSLILTHGTGSNWTLGLTAEDSWTGDQSRQATITVSAVDPASGASSSKSFLLTILPPRERAYTNNTPITITDNSAANPYPSSIKVSDLNGAVAKVNVRIHGFTHAYPDDVGLLLVSPAGKKVVLMNRAGGAGDVFGANIKFDQQAPTPIPDVGTIPSGPAWQTYQPADYRGGAYDFPAPAPGGVYTNSLDALVDGPASGNWSLYAYDAVLGDAGAITNGWSIAITTKPIMTGLTNVYMLEDQTVTQAFNIADDSRTTPTFTFTKTSSKTDVIPVNNIVITPVGSSGMDYTVAVSPVKFGSNVVITIAAQNTDGQTAQQSFTVDVGYKASAPVVGALANQTMLGGTVLVVPVVYYDAHTPTNELKVGASAANTTLLPAANLKMIGTNLNVAPVPGQSGTTTVSVSVTNNDGLVTTSSFELTVEPNPGVVANTGKITINDAAKASPYPSTIDVAGLTGTITDVNVTVAGITHSFPQDISILLVPPSGQGVVLMSRAAGSAPISNIRLVFDDDASSPLPATGTITDGTYRPADYKSSDSYYSPAPAGPYAKVLSAFDGMNPNGTWSLYVQDDAAQDAGAINQGWALNITTAGGKALVVGGRGPTLIIGQTAEGMQVSLNGTPNVDYAIQSSSDLNHWSDLGTVTADDSGKAVYTVQGGATPALFFRAVAR